MSSPSFNEKTTAGLEGGGVDGLDSELYLFILDSRQLKAAWGLTNCLSCHVLGSVDAMLRFIHAVGLLKLAVLVPVHACTQQIMLVFVCDLYHVPTLAYLWYLVLFVLFSHGAVRCFVFLRMYRTISNTPNFTNCVRTSDHLPSHYFPA